MQSADSSKRTALTFQSQRPHALTWLEEDRLALHVILRQLDLAQSSVEVDWHIRSFDETTRLQLFALTEIARRGVKVRTRLDFAEALNSDEIAIWQDELVRSGAEVREPRFPRLRIEVRKFWTRVPNSSATLYAPAGLQRFWNRIFQFQAGRSMQWIFDQKRWLVRSRADSQSALFIEGEVVRGAVKGFAQAWTEASAPHPSLQALTPNQRTGQRTGSLAAEQRSTEKANWARWLRHLRQPQLIRALQDRRRLCKDMLMAIEPATTLESKRVIPHILKNQAQRTRGELRLEFPHLSVQDSGMDLFQNLTQRKTPSRVLMNSLSQATHPASVALSMSRLHHLSLTQTDLALQSRKVSSPHHHLWLSDQNLIAYGNFNLRRRSLRAEPELMVMCRQSNSLVQDAQVGFEERWKSATPVLRAGVVENQRAWWADATWQQKAYLLGLFPIAHWMDPNL